MAAALFIDTGAHLLPGVFGRDRMTVITQMGLRLGAAAVS
jgi:hypothetical protein